VRHARPEILQSFWLRFWREPQEDGRSGEWRGTVWHEQQRPEDGPRAVANPEEAFKLIRITLKAASDAASRMIEIDASPEFGPPPGRWTLFWRKLRRTRP
jgi:hypothetical protein